MVACENSRVVSDVVYPMVSIVKNETGTLIILNLKKIVEEASWNYR